MESIGYVVVGSADREGRKFVMEDVERWARENDWEAVIWTDLASNFRREMNSTFSVEKAIDVLNREKVEGVEPFSLNEQYKSLEYIERAPREVRTPFREWAEEEFNLDPEKAS